MIARRWFPILAALCGSIALRTAGAAGLPARGPANPLPVITTIEQSDTRHDVLLDRGWRSIAVDTGAPVPAGVTTGGFDDRAWRKVDVPQNWDEYEGFHQVRHGDRHGTAWYRRTFGIASAERGRRIFLFFEGVGSYATVWLNGVLVGRHAGGQTTFTLDITKAAHVGGENLLVVRADHPEGIRDLPWVCGGDAFAYGFSEGTQPFGIFRPVHLITTDPVRIEPFGVDVWNGTGVTAAAAQVHVRTEVKNYGETARTFTLLTRIMAGGIAEAGPASGVRAPRPQPGDGPAIDGPAAGAILAEVRTAVTLGPGETKTIAQDPPVIARPARWSPASPYLYSLESELVGTGAGQAPGSAAADAPAARTSAAGTAVFDSLRTPFGIRTIHWPAPDARDGRFLVNGRPVFINGICEYEHNIGASHAFTPEQVRAVVSEIEAAGFNAFRDAHTPHNLRFQQYWDADGLLWWPQFGAHIWFDNAAFRANYKALLREWVKERRNSPSLVLWGLQNESVLPTKFAEECCAIIRQLDPTASSQRKITTCNGGTGTDWNVPQNWSGTYSGNLMDYANDLRREHLVGEYGAWRSLGLHSEGGFQLKGPLSEDRMTALLETKVRLAESVRSQVAGQFLWLFETHSNPGRYVGSQGEQAYDGIRPLDHISPANNKGLLTIWGEPVDAYEMYRGNYAPAATQPMVYIVSHTWPDRWTSPGRKSGIIVYSNCDQVELFNDLGGRSLGMRTRHGIGTHFEWDNVDVRTNILYAEGRIGGKVVACDLVQLHHLPPAPRFAAAQRAQPDLLAPRNGQNYLYRVNCGGPDYVDHDGNRWMADYDLTPAEYEQVGRTVGVAGLAEAGAGVSDPGNKGAPHPAPAWGSLSWAAAYPNLSPRFGSQRKTYDPIAGTRDPALFQTYRYGRDQLRYVFAVPDGDYQVELYFVEPWYGDLPTNRWHVVGDSASTHAAQATGLPGLNAAGWRLFDVAVNGRTVLHNFDLWRTAGRDCAIKRIVPAHVTDGRIALSFPRVAADQAVISAIAISSSNPALRPPPAPQRLITQLDAVNLSGRCDVKHALDTGDQTYSDAPGGFTQLPLDLLEADRIETPARADETGSNPALSFSVTANVTVYVAVPADARPGWVQPWEHTNEIVETNAAPGTRFVVYRNAFPAGSHITLPAPASAGAPMYLTFVVPRRPAPPPQLVRDIEPMPATEPHPSATAGSTPARPAAGWHATGNLAVGRELYTDATRRIAKLPDVLKDCDLVSPPHAARGGVAFTVSNHVEVYVALDPRITTRPAWLADWIPTRETIATTDPAAPKFILLRQRFKPDARVTLGSNGALPAGAPAEMYFAIVRAVRPAVFLEAEAARLTGAARVQAPAGYTGSGAVQLPPGAGHAIAWTVPVGVGDRYGLDFRFTAAAATPATSGTLTILGADGQVVRTDKLEFPAVTAPGHWTFLRTRTGASINAGSYTFRLTLGGRAPLILDSLEVE